MNTTPATICVLIAFILFLLAGLGVTVRVSASVTLSLRDLAFAALALAWLLA